MGVQLQDIGAQMRKVLIFSTRACYKIVCNHPILVGLLCFLALLYRSFPFVFSVLLSLSPVLVCTAVLLGTLLSFGQPNIPEIEREEKTVHDIVVPLKTGVLLDATVVEKDDESYSVDRYTTKETDTVDQLIEELGLGVNKLCEVERGDSFGDDAPLLGNKSREIELESRMFLEGGRELYDLGSKQKNEKNEERVDDGETLDHQYSPLPNVDDENLEFDNAKSVDSFDSRMVNIGSPVIDREILDRQYSPILNLDDENLEFDNDKSVDSFDSKMVNVDSPPGSPLEQEEEKEEEEEEDDEESFDSGSDRAESSSPDASMADIIPMLDELHPLLDEDTPHPINLLHDGSDAASERSKSCDSDQESDDGTENQEVEAAGDEKGDTKETTKDKQEQKESAISWTEEDQKNLMDLGSSELERNQRLESLIARRRARKSMRTMVERNLIDLESFDLPFNIAPISTARNNPFDLPGDLPGLPPIPGSAPSILQPRRNPFDLPYDSSEEKPDLKEDSFQQEFKTFPKDSFFRRHESFNIRPSLFGPSRHEKKDILFRPYFVPEEMDSEGSSYSRFQRQSSELSDSRVSSIPETESVASAIDLEDKSLIKEETEDKNLSDEDLVGKDLIYKHSSEDQALISGEEEHTSRDVGHGSQSSEVKWESEENHHIVEPSLMQEGYVAKALDLTVTEIHSKPESLERHSSHSSSSSLSEEGEKIFDESETHWLSGLGERRDHSESVISREASLLGADFDIRGTSVVENQYWEPVYDLSPTPLKEISSSSVSPDVHVESDMGLSPVLVDRTLSPPDMEAVESGQEIENSQPGEEDELISEDAMLLKNTEVSNLESSENCEVSFSDDPVVTGGVVREDSLDSKASVNTSADQNILDRGIDLFENEEHSSAAVQVSPVQPCTTFENPSLGDNQIDMEVTGIHLEHNGVHLSNLDPLSEPLDCKDHSEMQEPPLIVMESVEEASSTGQLNVLGFRGLDCEAQPITAAPSSPPFASILHMVDEVQNENHIDASKSHQFFTDAIEFRDNVQYIVEEEGIEEIDEGILSELDAVGDFSINESISSLNEFGSGIDSSGVSVPVVHNGGSFAPLFLEEDSIYVHGKIFAEQSENLNASLLTGNDWEPQGVDLNSNTEETNPGMPLVEAQSLKDLESIYEQAKLESVEPQEVQLLQNSNTEDNSPGLPLVEASSVKDLESIYEQAKLDSMETNLVLELSELNQNSNAEDSDPGMPLVEASSVRDLESIYEQAKSNSLETEVVPGVSELPQEVRLEEADTDSGMPVVVAQSIEDLDSAFRQIDSKESEKHDLLDPSHTDSGMPLPEVQSIQDTGSGFDQIGASGESENSKNVKLQEHSSLIENEIKFEARSTEDTDSDHLELHESDAERHILRDSLVWDADALESLHMGAPSHDSALKQETEDNAEKPMKSSSSSSQDVLVEVGDSSKGTSSVKDRDVPEDSNGDTKKLNFEVDKSKDSDLTTSAEKGDQEIPEKGDQETPEGDSSSAMDVKAKKEESPGDSHKE